MSSYVLGVDAELDLDDIWEYIAGDSIDAADRWRPSYSMNLRLSRRPQAWVINARISLGFPFSSGPWAGTSSSTGRRVVPLR